MLVLDVNQRKKNCKSFIIIDFRSEVSHPKKIDCLNKPVHLTDPRVVMVIILDLWLLSSSKSRQLLCHIPWFEDAYIQIDIVELFGCGWVYCLDIILK